MSAAKTINLGYVPRKAQAYLHQNVKRFNVIVMHRRAGKSIFSVHHMLHHALKNPNKNPQYAYICPTFGQAKRVIWTALKDTALKIPNAQANEADLRVDIERPQGDRVRIMLLGAENPDALRGIYLDGAILDEFADMPLTVWQEVIRPTLSDRLGWAIFVGTPKGRNHFCDMYERAIKGEDPEWFGALFRASETGIIAESELESAKKELDESTFLQEYECSFQAALRGSYYGKEMEAAEKTGRITTVPYDPSTPVDTFWDLGIGDSTAIWFVQQVGREVHAIDYHEASGANLAHYAKVVKEKPYVYGTHTLPHDGAARELGSGKTRQEQLKALGIRTRIQTRQGVDDGIQAARILLPRMWFDKKNCERGLKCLVNYQRAWDSKHQMFKLTPLHDQYSNGADAFRYLALGLREDRNEANKSLPRQAEMEWDIFTH